MKPTAALGSRLRRLPLTTKQAGKDYYKGTRSGQMGWHTKHGGYVINPNFVRTYKVPENLKEFKLSPFVSRNITKSPVWNEQLADGTRPDATSGARYLWQWKNEGGTI